MVATAKLRKYRRLAFKKQGGLCWWCNIRMFLPHEPEFKAFPRRRVTAEHLVPRGKGGTDAKHNIVAACANCNEKRKDYGLSEWLIIIPDRLKMAGNPEFYEIILSRLQAYGIENSGPQKRLNANEGLATN